ncbi:MAG: Ig-like domain-containing protein [Myxococcota bacterium]
MKRLVVRSGSLFIASLTLLALSGSSRAADADERPETWDMTQPELEEIGLGQSRGEPRPVPDHYPRRNLTTPPSEGGNPPPKIIFVNFDGAMLTMGADDAKNNTTQIGELAGTFAPYGVGDKRTAVMQATRNDWAAYNMDVVDTRPASGEYTMNMTGPTNPFGGGVLGIAPIDCGNFQTHSNITYAFHDLNDGFDAATTATTIGQEVAHSYGLEHVDEPGDILNPFNAGGDPSFIDECLPLSGGASCPDQHLLHCPDGTGQNSHQELLTMFGPAIPDTDGPIITVTAPLTGTTYQDGDGFTVLAEIIDDSLIDEATLYANGSLLQIDTTDPWGWQIMDLSPGLYALEIVAVDEYGNEGLSSPVSILIEGDASAATGSLDESGGAGSATMGGGGGTLGGMGSGSGDVDTESAGLVPGTPGGCGCTQQGSDAPYGFAIGLLLLAFRRRRS